MGWGQLDCGQTGQLYISCHCETCMNTICVFKLHVICTCVQSCLQDPAFDAALAHNQACAIKGIAPWLLTSHVLIKIACADEFHP